VNSAIIIENFSKSFGTQKAVDNLSLEVKEGEVMAFLGSNGSGKTTTIRCLLNIYSADEGKLLLDGMIYTSRLNHLLGYLPEERGIYTKARVLDLFVYFANLRGIKTQEAKRLALEYFQRVDLLPHQNKKISQLSSGMQQKVQIGVTIIHKPKILILDEPFKGLDPLNRQLFIDLFGELNKNSGTTILYSTHVVDEAQRIADSVIIINNGKRVVYGNIDEVRNSFGSNHIQLEFKGDLPENTSLYSAVITHNTAELSPKPGVSSTEIINFLVKNNLEIIEFKIDRPSLNSIFLQTAKK